MTERPPFRVTITQQALADTVVDDSRSGPDNARPSHHDLSLLPEAGELVGQQYRLVRLLGQGMFGKVYVAERVDVPEHRVALKMMPREVYAGRNVERELVMLAAAGHPNVVQLKDHGTTDQYVWLTMPVYEGETLSERLARGPLELREAYEIFLPIARGVEALHASGLRHQDLKPENIFLARFAGRLHPIILDLGVAAEISSTFVAGTILYGAPEQIEALHARVKVTVSEKIDTYCLAATLLLALVGPEFFPGDKAYSHEDIVDAQRERATAPLRAEALPQLSGRPREQLSAALRRWLALEPVDRAAVGQMAEELDVLLAQERELAAQAELRVVRQKAMIRRFRVAVGGLLLVGLGVVGYAYAKRNTLRLANELARVRAEEAQQFDKLETCAASHRISERQAAECSKLRARDQGDFKKTLEELSRANSTQGDCAKEIMAYNARLKVCEDGATAASKACATDKEAATSEWTARAGQLTSERDEARKTAEARAGELDKLTTELDKARSETRACQTRLADNPYVDPVPSLPTAVIPPASPPKTAAPATSAHPPAAPSAPPPPPTTAQPMAPATAQPANSS